jgi:Ala-tRNA(Pro) deacylase
MPPLGPLYGQRVFLDKSLAQDPEIVFNAGTHTDAIRMGLDDFVKLVNPVIGEFGIKPGSHVH